MCEFKVIFHDVNLCRYDEPFSGDRKDWHDVSLASGYPSDYVLTRDFSGGRGRSNYVNGHLQARRTTQYSLTLCDAFTSALKKLQNIWTLKE